MQIKRFELAKQYDEQIKRLRKEIADFEQCTFFQCKTEFNRPPEYCATIGRELNEFPRLRAYIKTALEEELAEYEEKLKNL